jgi:hypothetical protein
LEIKSAKDGKWAAKRENGKPATGFGEYARLFSTLLKQGRYAQDTPMACCYSRTTYE